jgi:hypothetical protein
MALPIDGCPYPDCQGTAFTNEQASRWCALCQREIWSCPYCGSTNRALALYCRGCGKFHEIAPVWPQEGHDARRTYRADAIGAFDLLTREGAYHLDGGGESLVSTTDVLLPAPILVGDLLIFTEPTFPPKLVALSIRQPDHRVWRRTLPFAKPSLAHSPIQFGAYVYYFSTDKNYWGLYRFAPASSDSGEPQICSVETPDGPLEETPELLGELIESSAPVLLPTTANDGRGAVPAGAWWCLLTTRGLLVLDLASAHTTKEKTSIAGRFHSFPSHGRRWYSPVVAAGRYLVATAANESCALLADLAALPDQVIFDTVPLPANSAYDLFSPCMVLPGRDKNQDRVCWSAYDPADNSNTAIISFIPPIRPSQLAKAHKVQGYLDLWTRQPSEFQPLSDGTALFVPAQSPKRHMGIAALFYPDGRPEFWEAPEEFLFSRCAPLGDYLGIATERGLKLLHPYGNNDFAAGVPPYMEDGAGRQPLTRPISGRGRVVVQCSDLVAVYRFDHLSAQGGKR